MTDHRRQTLGYTVSYAGFALVFLAGINIGILKLRHPDMTDVRLWLEFWPELTNSIVAAVMGVAATFVGSMIRE
jgi:galactitol-specific phosphotransferase system IIC component